MSKENIHIDDLFKPLKGYEHPVEGGFAEINDKLHDAAWKDQFDGYEHAVTDIPPFSALPMTKSDKAIGLKAAGKYALIVGIISLLTLVSYTAFNRFNKNQKQTINTALIEDNSEIQNNPDPKLSQSPSEELQGFDPNTKEQTGTTNTDAPSIGSMSGENFNTSGIESNTTNNNSQQLANGLSKNKSTPIPSSIKTNPHPKTESKPEEENGAKNTKDSEGTPVVPNLKQNNISNPNQNPNAGQPIKPTEPGPLTKSETNENNLDQVKTNPSKKILEENWFSSQRNINPFADAIPAQTLNKFKRNTFLPKPRLGFYAQIGLGFLSPNAPFADASPSNGLTYQAHLGIQYGRFTMYTGLEKSNYTYTTSLRNIQLYDSFPHLDINGDTIGFFKKNFRDTTINQNNSSRVVINSIPLHFQFKALQLGKTNIQFGTGLNINFINTKELWYNDNNNYLVNHGGSSTNTAKINLGLSLLARVGYRITPLTEIYGRLNIREAGNIFNSNNPALKPSGAQLDFGIRYHLK